MKTRLGWIGLLLSGVLVACPQPPQAVTPTPQTPTPTPVAFKPTLLGRVVIDFDSAAKTAKVKFDHVQTRVGSPTTFPAETDLKFTGNNFTVLDQGANRFISAGFQVQNLSLTTDFNNLTLVAYHRRSVVGSENVSASAFFNVQNFGGAFNPNVLTFTPAHGMTTSAGNVVVDNNRADLQVFSPSEITTLETDAATGSLINSGAISGEAVLGYGYVARNATNGRTIVKNTSDSSLTVGLKVPASSDPGANAYRYSMTFLVFTDNVTRVTESLEEQAASGASARATPLAATVAYLCGSSLTGGTFIPGAKTAGATNATAYMGGNLKITSTTAYGYVATGNTPKTVAVANTLLSHYGSLDGVATPTATTGLAAGSGGTATVNANGSFVFTPTVGVTGAKTFSYRVSDGGSCTTPDQSADVNITNMVWYVKNNVAGAGTGHFNDPFKTLASASGASNAGEYIFVYNGDNSSSNQNAGITLKANQKLVGEGDELIIAGDTIVSAGSKAKIGNSGGTGVTLASGNEIRGLDITGTSAGITGSGFGTATMSKTSVTASAGAALDLSTGVMAISLDKITASGGTNNLKLTSTTGTFVVNGDGVTAGSGGTLQGSSADGALLTNPGDVTLKFVNVTNAGTHGINLASSTGTQKLTLEKVAVQGAGVAVGTLGDGLNFLGTGSSTTTIAVNGSSFKTNEQNGMFITTPAASSATLALSVLGGTLFQNNAAAGLSVPLFGTGNATVDVQNNTFGPDTAGTGNAINLSNESTNAASLVQARIKTNTISMFSGSGGNGIEIATRNVGKMAIDASSNTISNFPVIGMRMLASGTNTKIDATVNGNTVTPATTTAMVIPIQGMFFASGTAAGTTSLMCLNLSSNNSTPGSGSPNDGYRVRQRLNTTFQLQGYAGAANSTAAVQSFITGQNTGTATAQAASATITVNYTSATCATPGF